jgi:hypothetical protein
MHCTIFPAVRRRRGAAARALLHEGFLRYNASLQIRNMLAIITGKVKKI